ncbi:MAG: UDP-N-acetylglucosamine 2-epimerase, partial [Rhodospirillaceae bacterium]
PVLAALRRLGAGGVQVIATYPNNDAGVLNIIEALEAFIATAPDGIQLHRSLGRYNYHGVLALARDDGARIACVGNSSSGIKETPAFGCPTVNIGSRQAGRLRAGNVIDAGYDTGEIVAAVGRCLDDGSFRAACRTTENPYGVGEAGPKVAAVLAAVALDANLIRKRMTLLGETRDGWFR